MSENPSPESEAAPERGAADGAEHRVAAEAPRDASSAPDARTASTASAGPGNAPDTERRVLVMATVAACIAVAGSAVFAAWHFTRAVDEVQLEPTVVETEVVATPPVVVSVRALARLETANFHMERVIDLRERTSHLFGLVRAEDAMLLVAAADITAGVDLAQLRDEDVRVRGDGTVEVTLPAPEIFHAALDADHTFVHTRSTDLLARRQMNLESRARREAAATLREAAVEAGILERAATNAERAVGELLRQLGHARVEVRCRRVVAG